MPRGQPFARHNRKASRAPSGRPEESTQRRGGLPPGVSFSLPKVSCFRSPVERLEHARPGRHPAEQPELLELGLRVRPRLEPDVDVLRIGGEHLELGRGAAGR